MRFEIVTLFPEFFEALGVGLLGKARDAGTLAFKTLSPREFATDKHRSVDDAPYGGGSGMVLTADPVVQALERLDAEREGQKTRRILLTPQGKRFDQQDAQRLSEHGCVTLICGRYEGFDERIRHHVDEELSIGDYVLLGGEAAALSVIEATARLVPGVLGNDNSVLDESHAQGALEYPQYTRPPEFRGEGVPDVLLSGDHAAIAAWRKAQSVKRTAERRPDLVAGPTVRPLYCALVHHPVRDRQGDEVTTSVTNIDVHDIARSSKTFGLSGYYIVNPISAQRPIVDKIIDHWKTGGGGGGARRIPERSDAIDLVAIRASVQEVVDEIAQRHQAAPELWATSAEKGDAALGYDHGRAALRTEGPPVLLLFGTGHGLGQSLLDKADARLAPIDGVGTFNHLSVRAAVAVTLDRLTRQN